MKRDDFIARAKLVHGDKFDYDLVPDEFSAKDNVPVICKIHGTFHTVASSHICDGRSCFKCASEKRAESKILKAKSSFIAKAKCVHGDKYDYSHVEYTKAKNKVVIGCIAHDLFWEVTANSHLSGSGCPLCARELLGRSFKKPREYFVEKAKNKHNSKYDYSLIPADVKAKDKVNIICKEHGIFSQTLFDHVDGKVGCRGCTGEVLSKRSRTDKDAFIAQAVAVHGDKYDYSNLVYTKKTSTIRYTCKVHGVVEQRGDHHLTTIGCPKCASDVKAEIFKFTTDEFIEKAKEIHFDTYDYSLVNYVNMQTKVDIICKLHGVFSQVPNSHLYAAGCPRCSNQKVGYRSNMRGSFYILKITDDVLKFGITNNMKKRVKGIQQKCKYPITILHYWTHSDGYVIRSLESDVIASGIVRGVIPKEDMLSGYTETFYAKDLPKVMDIVNKHIKPD